MKQFFCAYGVFYADHIKFVHWAWRSLVFALQIVTTRSVVPMSNVVIIELRFQIANHEGGMKATVIGAVARFN